MPIGMGGLGASERTHERVLIALPHMPNRKKFEEQKYIKNNEVIQCVKDHDSDFAKQLAKDLKKLVAKKKDDFEGLQKLTEAGTVIEKGIDLNSLGIAKGGQNILHLCVKFGLTACAGYLLEHIGMDPNWARDDGHGPLWVCRFFKKPICESYLSRFGAHENPEITTQKYEAQQEEIRLELECMDIGEPQEGVMADDSDDSFVDSETGIKNSAMQMGAEALNVVLPPGVHPDWQTHADRNMWTEHLDPGSGRFYYRNNIRNITLWDREALENGIIKDLRPPPKNWKKPEK